MNIANSTLKFISVGLIFSSFWCPNLLGEPIKKPSHDGTKVLCLDNNVLHIEDPEPVTYCLMIVDGNNFNMQIQENQFAWVGENDCYVIFFDSNKKQLYRIQIETDQIQTKEININEKIISFYKRLDFFANPNVINIIAENAQDPNQKDVYAFNVVTQKYSYLCSNQNETLFK